MTWYDLAVRVVVAAVLLVAGFGKLRDAREVEREWRAGPLGGLAPVAAGVPVLELVTGVALLTSAPAASIALAVALFAGFVAYLVADHRRGATTCACLGARRTRHGVMITLDLALLAALVPLLATPGLDRIRPLEGWAVPGWIAVLLLGGLLVHRSQRGGGRYAEGAPPVELPGPERRPAPSPVPPGAVVFTSAGCPSCDRLRPRLAGAALVDVDERPDLADAWGVTHTPSAFLVDADGSTTVRPAVGEDAVGLLLSDSR